MRAANRKFPYYMITGLVLGFALGLVYAWVLSPIEPLPSAPGSLKQDHKDDYRALIASAYLGNSDIGRAKARLALLEDLDPVRALTLQAQLELSQKGGDFKARALGILAANYFQEQPQTVLVDVLASETLPATLELPVTHTPSPTASATLIPSPTLTALPTRTPTATPGAAFLLDSYSLVCNETYKDKPLIMVNVLDSEGEPLPGVRVNITWDQGQSHFYTGLKLEFGLGYADFEMQPDIEYLLWLADGGDQLPGLSARECENDDGLRWFGSWEVNFYQPR